MPLTRAATASVAWPPPTAVHRGPMLPAKAARTACTDGSSAPASMQPMVSAIAWRARWRARSANTTSDRLQRAIVSMMLDMVLRLFDEYDENGCAPRPAGVEDEGEQPPELEPVDLLAVTVGVDAVDDDEIERRNDEADWPPAPWAL